ncbi:spermidine synthase [Clostridium pasteurianum]|uniref:Polyamine aminopropyltransferase n=1 Tax=Clostridium pasteurianum BC1 TaxID=86416 RepID=R4KAK7_CLOPA|nr:spermidine synthase [Clostridium pasteurianum]AGK96675.1 spermidine synthase [Clostridium pasteurianum BC1]
MLNYNKKIEEEIVYGEYHTHTIKRHLYSGYTKYHYAEVVEFESSGLALLLDKRIQSCQIDEFVYNEAAVHPALLMHPHPNRVLCLAGGMGGIVREVLKHENVKEVVVMDEDPIVSEIIEKFLPHMKSSVRTNQKLNIYFGNCLEFLSSCEPFDVIIFDSTDPTEDSPYASLFTQESYHRIYDALNADGILSIQLGSVHPATINKFLEKKINIAEKFPFVNPYHVEVHSLGTSWGFALASKREYELNINILENVRYNKLKSSLHFFDDISYKRMWLWPKHLSLNINKI